MKLGDLVREKPKGIYFVKEEKRRMGVIIYIDPLRREIIASGGHIRDTSKTVEIVIGFTNGTLWYADTRAWEVMSGT